MQTKKKKKNAKLWQKQKILMLNKLLNSKTKFKNYLMKTRNSKTELRILIANYLKKKLSEERYVTFISDRRKVVLPIEAILYVESNDKEVLLHTQEGLTGRGPVFRNGLSGSTIGSSVFIGPI